MRIESSVTSLSWIPQGAVEGFNRLSFGIRVAHVEIDGRPVAEVGPGAIVGEMALLHQGRRMATLRAMTPCRVAVVPKDRIDRQALEEIAKGRLPHPEP
jgi:CRP-like cAMP-binding protein